MLMLMGFRKQLNTDKAVKAKGIGKQVIENDNSAMLEYDN